MKEGLLKYIEFLKEEEKSSYKKSQELRDIHEGLSEWNLGLSHAFMGVIEELEEIIESSE